MRRTARVSRRRDRLVRPRSSLPRQRHRDFHAVSHFDFHSSGGVFRAVEPQHGRSFHHRLRVVARMSTRTPCAGGSDWSTRETPRASRTPGSYPRTTATPTPSPCIRTGSSRATPCAVFAMAPAASSDNTHTCEPRPRGPPRAGNRKRADGLERALPADQPNPAAGVVGVRPSFEDVTEDVADDITDAGTCSQLASPSDRRRALDVLRRNRRAVGVEALSSCPGWTRSPTGRAGARGSTCAPAGEAPSPAAPRASGPKGLRFRFRVVVVVVAHRTTPRRRWRRRCR